MDFKHEYQSEMQKLSPTDEQLERIKNGVMRRIAEQPPTPKKKTISLKAAAITMGSVCAAAVTLFVFLNVNIFKEDMIGTNAASPDHSLGGEGIYWEMSGNSSMEYNTGASEPTWDNAVTSADSLSKPSSFDNASKVTTDSPSLGDGSKADSDDYDTSSIGETPVLIFSEDEELCSVILNGRQYDYRAVHSDSGFDSTEYIGTSLTPTSNNLDQELFVRFDENGMTVITENGNIYKQYTLK